MDFSQFLDKTLLGLLGYAVLFAGALTTFAKPFIEQKYSTANTIHDRVIQGTSCLFGVIFLLLGTYLFDTFRTPQQVIFDALVGIACGLAASGNYKLLTILVGPITPVAGKVSKLVTRVAK